jgi:hypothetical protein
MFKLFSFSLTALAAASLVACGGGGSSTPTSTPSGTVSPIGSAAAFLAAGLTTQSYNLNNCRYTSPPVQLPATTYTVSPFTAVMTIDSTGAVRFVAPAFGTGQSIAPAVDVNINTSPANGRIEVIRDGAGLKYQLRRSGPNSGNGLPSVIANYRPSTYGTSNPTDNSVQFNNADNGEWLCEYAANPNLVLNFTNYNARIASGVAGLTTISNASAARSLVSGVATWDNGSRNLFARLDLATGRLSSSTSLTGQFTEFNIADALANSMGTAVYRERYDDNGGISYEVTDGFPNGYRFNKATATTTELNSGMYYD